MRPQPPRRYSKTDLRRGAVAPIQPAQPQTQVAADEQAALFGEAENEKTNGGAEPAARDRQNPQDPRD